MTDYCCRPGEHSEQFKKYLEQRQYHLVDVESYGKVSKLRYCCGRVMSTSWTVGSVVWVLILKYLFQVVNKQLTTNSI